MRIPALLVLSTLGALAIGSDALAQQSGVEVNGQLGVNYTHNFNKPANGSNTYLFNSSDSEFRLNLAEVRISKKATERSRAGFTIRLIDGDVGTYFTAMSTFTNKNVLEAFGTQLLAHGDRDVRVDAGQFLTGYGMESVGIGHFVSRSFAFQFLQPRLAQGLRATLELDEDTSITGVVQNRFNGVEAGNRNPSLGLSYARKMGEDASLKLNLLSGRENLGSSNNDTGSRTTGGVNRETSMANLVYHRMVGESANLGLDVTLRSGKDIVNRRYDATGVAAYYQTGALAIRGEYLTQSNATSGILPSMPLAASKKPNLTSITLGYTLPGAGKGVKTILEYRYDRAPDFFFPGSSTNSLKKDQSSITIGQAYSF